MQSESEKTGVSSYPPKKRSVSAVVNTGFSLKVPSDYARHMAGGVFGAVNVR